MAAVLQDLGRLDEARDFADRSLEMKLRLYSERLYPLGHPDLIFGHITFGLVCSAHGDSGEAVRELEKALEMELRILGAYVESVGESEATAFHSLNSRIRDEILSELRSVADSDAGAYQVILSTKGIIERVGSARRRALALIEEASDESRELARELP